MTKILTAIFLLAFMQGAYADADSDNSSVAARKNNDDCKGPQGRAVTTLPPPLDAWAQIVCTPYGAVIAAHDGWVWNYPGGYSPVVIPSQMVRENPLPLGSAMYFTKIDFKRAEAKELEKPLAAFHSLYRNDPTPDKGYRLDVVSVSGRSLLFYLFETGYDRWGIWCPNGECDPTSMFMILDMKHRPDEKPVESP